MNFKPSSLTSNDSRPMSSVMGSIRETHRLQTKRHDGKLKTKIDRGHSRYRILNYRFDARLLVKVMLYYSVIMESLISLLGFPESIRYVNDALLCLTLATGKVRPASTMRQRNAYPVLIAIIMMFAFDISTAFLNLVSPTLVIWAIRNTFRGIFFFFCVIELLSSDEIETIFSVFIILQLPNLLLAVYQWNYLADGNGDYVHGWFANGAGTNMFNALLCSYTINRYLQRKTTLFLTIYIVITSLIIATLAEEKTFFLYLVIIIFVALLANRPNFNTTIIILSILLCGALIFNWIVSVQPDMVETLLSPDRQSKYLQSTWADAYGIPRIGAFKFISNVFFHNDFIREMVGFGFGSCEYAQFTFLQSPFAILYGHLMYRSFTHQWVFLETGYIGFILFVLVFVVIAIVIIRNLIKHSYHNTSFAIVALTMSFCCIISMWSNSTLKLDASYFPYFGLALGFIRN